MNVVIFSGIATCMYAIPDAILPIGSKIVKYFGLSDIVWDCAIEIVIEKINVKTISIRNPDNLL